MSGAKSASSLPWTGFLRRYGGAFLFLNRSNDMQLSRKARFIRLIVLVAAVSLGVTAFQAMAGTNADFNTIETTLEGWLTGSLGKVIALACLAVGLGIGIVKQNILAVVVGVAMALALVNGPT